MASTPVIICVAFTVVVLVTAWLHSVPCADKAECVALKGSQHRESHAFAALGLGLLFLRESVGLSSTIRELHETKEMWSTRKVCPPVFLLCSILFVLTTIETIFWMTDTWSHAMPSLGGATEAWRPIHSFRYFEWMINVPMLIILAGNCALARPMKEVIPPVVITNCYVSWAWAAQVATSPSSRGFLILMTFVGYSWASWIMCVEWVRDFLSEKPFNGRSQYLRILVPVGLTLLLIAYAFIYLAGIAGFMSADVELKSFTLAGFMCKVGFSAVFAYFRWVEDRQNLASLMGKVGTVNTTLLAILKSTFDILVTGVVNDDGTCTLSHAKTPDASELERVLSRPAAGISLDKLVSGDQAKAHLAVYAQNVIRQVDSAVPTSAPLSNSILDPKSTNVSPIAQVLHCAMQSGEEANSALVRAKVHISPIPKSMQHQTAGRDVIVAIAFDSLEQLASEEPIDEAAANLDEAATEVMKEKLMKGKLMEGEMGNPRRRHVISNRPLGGGDGGSEPSDNTTRGSTGTTASTGMRESSKSTGTGGSTGGGTSEYSWEGSQADSQVLGGSDVGSQPSKQTYIGSVHMAARQLLGPLLDTKAPADLSSQRVEDHMDVAAQLVRMQGPAAMAHYKYQQELEEWNEKQKAQALVNMLEKSKAGEGVDDTIWFSEILPRVRAGKPGRKPKKPDMPADQKDLWQKAYDMTYEEDAESATQ
mmetsp:Transcript_58189/g.138561  ORF Transcript_58189/g.138561 Transcript_58189/m.138561 type:complete len:705 (-) Transcript_58189:108-2222(-)|eukprot:CAMPEP_0178426784 /NCGR_PEP_ID=MMETSP0689_2-20121128/29410_1 /TAXON_ID=160604 /ORGANISM="Amphidinium massartii, Strain CS-259" /LENGTH=704 /DNA_ID=CAMNT_0020048475 /DNA_START=45 /DNA_END=2159 /DNA_ORIENTATION=-